MAAFAIEQIVSPRYYVRLDSGVAENETDFAFVLDTAAAQTESRAAVLYRFEPEDWELNAIAVRSGIAARVKDAGVTLTPATGRWIEGLAGPAQGAAAGDRNFEKFPEVFQYQLKRLLMVPLRTENELSGLFTLGRAADDVFDGSSVGIAQRIARLLEALLERDSLQQKLLERKLVERAKGILQHRRGLSEEQTYLMLRSNSRRRRMPMVNLAREIIEAHNQDEAIGRWRTV